MDLMRLISKRGFTPNIKDKDNNTIYIPEDIINIIKDYINRPVYLVRVSIKKWSNECKSYDYYVYGLSQTNLDKEKLFRPIPQLIVEEIPNHDINYAPTITHLSYHEVALVNDDRKFLTHGCYWPYNVINDELDEVYEKVRSEAQLVDVTLTKTGGYIWDNKGKEVDGYNDWIYFVHERPRRDGPIIMRHSGIHRKSEWIRQDLFLAHAKYFIHLYSDYERWHPPSIDEIQSMSDEYRKYLLGAQVRELRKKLDEYMSQYIDEYNSRLKRRGRSCFDVLCHYINGTIQPKCGYNFGWTVSPKR